MFLDFEYRIPSGQVVLVEAEVTDGKYSTVCSPSHSIELLSTTIEGKEIDLEGLWFRKFGSLEMINVLDDIQDLAWEKYSD